MPITYHYDIEQGTDEWHDLRRGKITASAIKAMLTATGKIADNETSRRVAYQLAAERINGFRDESPSSYHIERGHTDEAVARELYSEHIAPVTECGFVTNDDHGVVICCSPDGLVADHGGIEVKSRLHALQLQTVISGEMPKDYYAQVQTCLLVTGREWWDFISTPANGGGKMMVKTIYPDRVFQELLIEAAKTLEERIQGIIAHYEKSLDTDGITFINVPRQEPEPSCEVKL